MNKQNTQTGSAHVILIVILIVVILGGLGFVAYKALSKPAETKTSTSTKSTADTSAEATDSEIKSTDTVEVEPSNNDIVFKDWGVSMTQPDGGDIYTTKQPAGDSYYIHSTKVNDACSKAGGEREPKLKVLSRFVKDAKATNYDGSTSTQTNEQYYAPYGVVGNYVYVDLPGGNAACSDNNDANSVQNAAMMSFHAQVKTLKQL